PSSVPSATWTAPSPRSPTPGTGTGSSAATGRWCSRPPGSRSPRRAPRSRRSPRCASRCEAGPGRTGAAGAARGRRAAGPGYRSAVLDAPQDRVGGVAEDGAEGRLLRRGSDVGRREGDGGGGVQAAPAGADRPGGAAVAVLAGGRARQIGAAVAVHVEQPHRRPEQVARFGDAGHARGGLVERLRAGAGKAR